VLLLRQADRRLGLVSALDRVLADPRHPLYTVHEQVDLLRQRIYGLALGYEDLNDHATLRHDLAWQNGAGVRRGAGLESDALPAGEPSEPSGGLGFSPSVGGAVHCRRPQRVDP
jgi:hypothetical protein